jgi:signal-transduction protein with cAMP-binding, CBS, and nucleotidyltransferase domain
MRVDEICSHRIVHVQATATLQQAARLMRDESARALLVTEHAAGGSRVVGIVTDRDMVVHGLASRSDCSQTAVSEVMTRGLLTIHDDAVISEALRSMLSHGLHRLDDTIRAMGGEWTLLAGILGRDNAGQSRQHAPSDLIL